MRSVLTVDTDPADVGLDAGRLARLDARLARWVDDGQLPGFLVTVARAGQLAHVGSYGHRDVEAGLPVTPDTIWRIFSMTKPITSVAAMSLYEEGAFELTDPITRWLPEFADTRVYVAGLGAEAGDRAPDRADPGLAPAHPHLRADLRLPPRPPGRRRLPRRRPRVGHPARRRLRRGHPAVGVDAAGVPARQRVELRGVHRRPGPAGRGDRRQAAGRGVRRARLRPAGHDRDLLRPAPGRRPGAAGPALLPRRRAADRVRAGRQAEAGVPVRRRRAWCPRPGTT